MLENRTATAAESTVARAPSAEPSRRLRSRTTNDPASALSKNTSVGRRAADLLRGFLAAMGNPTDIMAQAAALRAAELCALAEAARSALLRGVGDTDTAIRLDGASRRAVAALAIDRKREPDEPSLDQYLRDRYGGRDDEHEADDRGVSELVAEGETLTGDLPRAMAEPSAADAAELDGAGEDEEVSE